MNVRHAAILLTAAACVGGTPKDDDSGAEDGPAGGRWVGVCTAVITTTGGQTGAVPVTTTTTTTTTTTPTTPTTTPAGTGSSFYYSGADTYYYYTNNYYYSGVDYVSTYTILLDPAVLTLSDEGGALEGTFGYSLDGDSYPPWVVEGTRSGVDVHLDVTGALQTTTTTFTSSGVAVHFDLVLDGDAMAGTLVVDYTGAYGAYDVATSTTTAGAPAYYTGSRDYYYYSGYVGYVPETLYIPCTFTRE